MVSGDPEDDARPALVGVRPVNPMPATGGRRYAMPATGSLATPSTTYGRSRCSHTELRCGGLIPAGFSRVQVSARVFTPGRSPGCRYEKRGGQSTTPLPPPATAYCPVKYPSGSTVL